MAPTVQAVFSDQDQAREAYEELGRRGIPRARQDGPTDAHIHADDVPGQVRWILIGIVVGTLVLAAVFGGFSGALFADLGGRTDAVQFGAVLGAMVGMVFGGLMGLFVGALLHPDRVEEIRLERGEVLVRAEVDDPDGVEELLSTRGARLVEPGDDR